MISETGLERMFCPDFLAGAPKRRQFESRVSKNFCDNNKDVDHFCLDTVDLGPHPYLFQVLLKPVWSSAVNVFQDGGIEVARALCAAVKILGLFNGCSPR